MLDIRVLGPTRIITANRVVSPDSIMVNAILFTLACHHGRPVSADVLCDLLWDDPPAHPHANIRTYIHQLRRLLEDPTMVRTYRSGGGAGAYALMAGTQHVDTARFATHLRCAKIAAHHNDSNRTRDLARAAMDCWSGDLIGLPHTRALHTLTVAWDRARSEAAELYITAALATGRRDCVETTEVAWHAITHPYRYRAQKLLHQILSRKVNGAKLS